MRWARPSTTAVADAGLLDEHLFFVRREDLHDPLDLGLAPDDGVELALGRLAGEVAAELVEQLRALRLLARRLPLLAAAGPESMRMISLRIFRVGVEIEENARGDALVLAYEAEEDVLGADVVVAERQRLAQRQLENSSSRAANGICPLVTSSPWPTMRATWARTSSTVMSRDSSTRAARPSSSRRRPSRMCSVPM